MKSMDWVKATAERRATLMTSLDRISTIRTIGDRECQNCVNVRVSGQRACEGRDVDRGDAIREY